MYTSYNSAVEKFFSLHKEAETWKSGEINITVAHSLTNDNPTIINLSSTIGHNKHVPNVNQRSNLNCYWFPQSFNKNNEEFRQKEIHPHFVRACHAAGFIVHGEYEKRSNCIQFECMMAKYHDEEQKKKDQDKRPRDVKNKDKPPVPRVGRRTARPLKSDKGACTFRFRVYWDGIKNRWFLPHKQSGNLDHCGHIHEDPEFLRFNSKFAPEREREIAEDALDCHISSTSTSKLFNKRTGLSLEWHQMHYLKQRKKNDLVMDANTSLGLNKANVTAADRLIADLDDDPRTSYVCLFGEFESGLLKLKTKRKTLNNAIEVDEFSEDLGDDVDSPEKFARDCKAISELTHSSTGKILLAIAWTNSEARRKFDMYPEFLGGDNTEETNSEDRPLYTLCGKDNMNKSFGHTWCFMPSKATWVYTWIFANAVPILHPGTAVKRVQLFVTDADNQETRAAEYVCGRGI